MTHSSQHDSDCRSAIANIESDRNTISNKQHSIDSLFCVLKVKIIIHSAQIHILNAAFIQYGDNNVSRLEYNVAQLLLLSNNLSIFVCCCCCGLNRKRCTNFYQKYSMLFSRIHLSYYRHYSASIVERRNSFLFSKYPAI